MQFSILSFFIYIILSPPPFASRRNISILFLAENWLHRFCPNHISVPLQTDRKATTEYLYHMSIAGCDRIIFQKFTRLWDFYSRAPRGAWLRCGWSPTAHFWFLLTRPSRGVTPLAFPSIFGMSISTHTPLAGRDPQCWCTRYLLKDFYSHAPRGAWRKL